jgi:hypothetical protein
MKRFKLLLLVGVLAAATLACSLFNIVGSERGTLTVETILPLQVIQTTIENSADFSNIVDMQLEPRDGYIFVSAGSVEFQGFTARNVSLHLELGVRDGQLDARITNVNVSNNLFDETLFESANRLLAERLSEAAQQNERAELLSVDVTQDGVKMVWQIDTSRQQ